MDPLSQFKIKIYLPMSLCGIDISFTNASLYMLLSVLAFCVISYIATYKTTLIPSKGQTIIENLYLFVRNMLEEFSGAESIKYFPGIFTLFIFILCSNLMGLLPGAFTTTSHVVVTGALALIVFIAVTCIGFSRHGLRYLKLFVPDNIPFYVLPILVPVEILSYFMRPVSLAMRLFANMVAGHVMIKIFATFTVMLLGTNLLPLSVGPVFINTIITFFELVVCMLQAYIFTILTCIYLNDALNLH